jgi:hypothetical protein
VAVIMARPFTPSRPMIPTSTLDDQAHSLPPPSNEIRMFDQFVACFQLLFGKSTTAREGAANPKSTTDGARGSGLASDRGGEASRSPAKGNTAGLLSVGRAHNK